MAELRIGTSGYQYDHWRGVFYPEGLPKSRWFAFYAERFDTVEINNTFYCLPDPGTFDAWRAAAPEGFLFALKYSRFGTHLKHLRDPQMHLPRFVERARRLGPHLGPVLVQLPPRWTPDVARLAEFLEGIPPGRWAVEVRDARWLREDVYAVLRAHGVALVTHDLLPDHPEMPTAGWMYLRFHGARRYGAELAGVAARVRAHLAAGRDVYAYFNNDLQGHAIGDALELRRRCAA
jgi:uncharacterized protein YecE (DUF72 family)